MSEKKVTFGNSVGLINTEFRKGIILYSGFLGTKDESHGLFKDFIPFLYENGFSTLRIDVSGLGESSKDFSDITFKEWYEDTNQAINYFNTFDIHQIGIVGFSLGATHAILNYLKNDTLQSKIKGLALWAPAFNPRDDMLFRYKENGEYNKAQEGLLFKSGKHVSTKLLDSLDFTLLEEIKNVSCPVLICHSKEDPYIPIASSQTAMKRISFLDELVVLYDSGHSFRNVKNPSDNVSRNIVYDKTLAFFNKYINKK